MMVYVKQMEIWLVVIILANQDGVMIVVIVRNQEEAGALQAIHVVVQTAIF